MVVCFLCSEAERAGSSTRQAQEGRTGRVAVGRRRRTGTSSRRRGDASARTRRGSEALARGTAQEVSGRTRRWAQPAPSQLSSEQWRSKVGAGPCARIPKGPPPPLLHAGFVWAPYSDKPAYTARLAHSAAIVPRLWVRDGHASKMFDPTHVLKDSAQSNQTESFHLRNRPDPTRPDPTYTSCFVISHSKTKWNRTKTVPRNSFETVLKLFCINQNKTFRPSRADRNN